MSPQRPPRDAAERARASGDLKSSLMVEAGAGTGKTTVLLDRVSELLKTTVVLERIAIITFTEKAAGELKVKLRRRIETMIRGTPAPGTWSDHLRRSLESLDRATVTTIHAFAAALLRERPVEAQVDPRFVVADELSADMLREAVWERWLEKEMTAGALPLARALRVGMKLPQLQELAMRILDQRDVELEKRPGGAGRLEAGRDRVLEIVNQLVEASSACTDPSDHALAQIQRLARARRRLKERQGDLLLLEMEALQANATRGSRESWAGPDSLKRVRDLLSTLAQERDAATQDARTRLAHEVGEWIRDGFVAACQQEKAVRRLLDFGDLLIRCRDLLRGSAAARAAFQDRFDCLMVDEFQDTDPLQAEILFLLAADDPGQGDWRQVRPRPGKLFVVGDPKQSIYRFRRADIETYDEVKSKMPGAPGQKPPRLTENFRTVPSIAAWVNDLFGQVLETSDRRWQPAYERLVAHREEPDAEGARVVMLVPSEQAKGAEQANAAVRRQSEARAVTALLHAARGSWAIGEREGRRPARWSDMALLFRATTGLEAFEDALREAGIPYRLNGGRRYYMRAEMRSLQAVLQAIERPHDPLAVVSALRCPIFGHSDEELLAHAALGRGWVYTRAGEGSGTPFERVFELLARLHARRNARSVAATLEDLMDATGALSLFYLKPDGDQRAANLLKAVDLARAHDAAGGGTFGSFTRWLLGMAVDERDEAEAPISEEIEPDPDEREEGEVRVLTVHKAKGLEFPIVALCDLSGAGSTRPPTWIVERGGSGEPCLQFCIGREKRRFASTGFEDALQRETARLEAESHRLLYVAATRARDWLAIPCFGGERPDGWMKVLAKHGFLPTADATRHKGARVVTAASLAEPHRETRAFRLPRDEGGPRDPSLIAERAAWERALKSSLEAPVLGRVLRSPAGHPAPQRR
ncbi:MAG: UvrD-helicase domain-containing protein, partial [Candidatus Polarisedimenticolia bacterium]